MPLSVRVDGEARLVRIDGAGLLSLADLTNALTRMLDDPAFEPGLPQLCDLSSVDETDLTTEAVQRLVRLAAAEADRLGGSPVAIVAPEPVIFGLSRMYQVLAEEVPARIRVFHDVDDALAWLRSA